MWFFILFSIIHIYLVFYHDYVERNGVTSSMIGGWKFYPRNKVEREKELEKY
jgi:Ni/Fe-hydrogenase 1 B-type cytochrome subunit